MSFAGPKVVHRLARLHDPVGPFSFQTARIKQIGKTAIEKRVYPHMFRRTLATMAIDKGMPIEQVQTLLGHVKIDTTLHYAMVNQENVKNSHRKFIE